jgi:hypothetical protein
MPGIEMLESQGFMFKTDAGGRMLACTTTQRSGNLMMLYIREKTS